MAENRYRIKLGEEERRELKAVVASKAPTSKRHRAQKLLCADENHEQGGMKDRDIARAVGVSVPCVTSTLSNFEVALHRSHSAGNRRIKKRDHQHFHFYILTHLINSTLFPFL